MYSTTKVRNSIQATPQGRRHQRAGVGFELAIKRFPALRHDQSATTLCTVAAVTVVVGSKLRVQRLITVTFHKRPSAGTQLPKPVASLKP